MFVRRRQADVEQCDRVLDIRAELNSGPSDAGRSLIGVGATIGTSTINLMSRSRFDCAIAIAPTLENIALLRWNLIVNDLSDRVEVVQVAVSDRAGRSC